MRIRILYDNKALPDFRADWGFACLLEADQTVLFDTGASPDVLRDNMEAADVEPGAIDQIVISHDHWDHNGGLAYLMDNNDHARVFILPAFELTVRRQVPDERLVEVAGPRNITPSVRSSGPVPGPMSEQAVAVDSEDGKVVVTGCAHPGVDALLGKFTGRIRAVLGGFHGFSRLGALQDIPLLAPCHCTEHAEAIAERYPRQYREIMAGTVLEF
ncbi:MAG: MBL fold metallo-hydrolase [Candidatus Brocadiia bacterium]